MNLTKALLTLALAATVVVQSQAAAPESFKVSEFNFKRPASWEWVEVSSSMRAAQLKVPAANGAGEVVFFYFGPGGGGGTKANVDRWLGQFAEPRDVLKPKVDEVTVGGTKVTYVHAEGTYQSGMPGGAKTPLTNHALLGAIVEGGQGAVFIRMTAPKDLVKSSMADFKAMVESPLKK
ncbi:MAG TPA: hypothetical protein VK968_06410 [Roseimicrobium sp.]|nr:hypothetical protein [Roseimicrobium sp.]